MPPSTSRRDRGARVDRGGIHGPEDLAAAERGSSSAAPSDPLLAANANLADQVRAYQRRLDESREQSERISKEQAGNKPMPPPGELDPVASRLLAMTSAASQVEKELVPAFGPDEAKRLAYGDSPWACALEFGHPADNDPQRSLGVGSQ